MSVPDLPERHSAKIKKVSGFSIPAVLQFKNPADFCSCRMKNVAIDRKVRYLSDLIDLLWTRT